MSPFRSVGARLSLALVIVVAVALGVVYAIVVPLLERTLIDNKLDQLTRTALGQARDFPVSSDFGLNAPVFQPLVEAFVDEAAATTNARVVLLRPLATGEPTVLADSRETSAAPSLEGSEVALQAALAGAPVQKVIERNNKSYAEVAFPVQTGLLEVTVLLFSAPLDETLSTVEVVKRRVVAAGGIALLVALFLGFGAASVFARRIRRLERAADRIGQGKLDEPVIVSGSDELGQLARAFEHMRLRLAQLEHARREFIANASHELRTPIFSLGGFLELLDDSDLDEETRREFLVTMQSQVERLAKLATDLLDLSRLDAGRLHVEAEPLELLPLASALVEEFAAIARAVDHPLEVADESEEATAIGDELRVLQIGRVLVENALRHTAPGTAVRVAVRATDTEAILSVEDEGVGIPTEQLAQVFERFYRVDGTRASGSGLGLAIARELAEAMGGSVELESRPGRTVVTLRLPVAAAHTRRRELEPAVS